MYSILLVSNNDIKFLTYNVLLSRYYNVVIASSGKQALDLIDDGFQIDLMILNSMMKHIDGYEILKQIRMRRHAVHMPVILFGETGFDVFKLNTFKIGAVFYLTRSESYFALMDRVRDVINTHVGSNDKDPMIKCSVKCDYTYRYFCDDS